MNNAGEEQGPITSKGPSLEHKPFSYKETTPQEQLRLAEQEYRSLFQREQQARQAAEAAQERLIDILDHLTDGFMIFDQEWRYRYINPQAMPFTGKPPEELLGQKVWEVFPHLIETAFYQQYHHAVETQQPVSFHIFSAMLDHWFDVRAYPIIDGLVVYFRQITDEVQREKERTHLLEATQTALAVRNTFLSSVSHDLKTPLAAIKANAQLIQRRIIRGSKMEDAWLLERVEAMDQATTKMAGMIDDLLSLTRSQSGQQSENVFLQLDFLPLLKAAVAEQQTTTKRHRLRLTSDDRPFYLLGNDIRLDRAIINLLSNAIKYSPRGGEITLTLTREKQDQQEWAILRISDQGVGIPASDLPHIFEPFHRASNVVGRIQGTGIGLSSVAQVIEQHQGSIAVTSEEGQGSTFTIRLPLLAGDQAPVQTGEQS